MRPILIFRIDHTKEEKNNGDRENILFTIQFTGNINTRQYNEHAFITQMIIDSPVFSHILPITFDRTSSNVIEICTRVVDLITDQCLREKVLRENTTYILETNWGYQTTQKTDELSIHSLKNFTLEIRDTLNMIIPVMLHMETLLVRPVAPKTTPPSSSPVI